MAQSWLIAKTKMGQYLGHCTTKIIACSSQMNTLSVGDEVPVTAAVFPHLVISQDFTMNYLVS